MKRQLVWCKYMFFNGIRKGCQKLMGKPFTGSRYGKKEILPEEAGNDNLKELIKSDKPFMAGRFGSTELTVMRNVITYELGISGTISKGVVDMVSQYSGFFPKEKELVRRFGNLMCEKCSQADLIGIWFLPMEDYVLDTYAPGSQITYLRGLEPWYHKDPWSQALEGKKVLVIHPFVNTIERQYEKRELLFPGTHILPEFQLQTLKAVQTLADQEDTRFATWFEALDYMYQEAMKRDFDLAILGCGAYGFPLAAKLKEAGKQVVHMGGATQLLFGIKGARWDNHPIISKLYNDHWSRPDETEKPKSFQKVEEGCYW